jgi:hypothetical protein
MLTSSVGWSNYCWSSPAQSILALGLAKIYDQSFCSFLDMCVFRRAVFLCRLYVCCTSVTDSSVCLSAKLLLVLASTIIPRFQSRGTHDHILLSSIRDTSTWRTGSMYLFPPVTGRPGYTPRHRLPYRCLLRWRYSNSPPHENNVFTFILLSY